MRLARTALVVTIPFFLLASACDSNSTEPPPANTVNVSDNFFNPGTLPTTPGATVTWNWTGSQPHNVTWVTAPLANSGDQSSGTHQVTMPSETGSYTYYCTIHGTPTAGMRGTITVQ